MIEMFYLWQYSTSADADILVSNVVACDVRSQSVVAESIRRCGAKLINNNPLLRSSDCIRESCTACCDQSADMRNCKLLDSCAKKKQNSRRC